MTTTDDRTEGRADGFAEDGGSDRAGSAGQGPGPGPSGPNPFGPELGPLVDEVRRFATTVGQKAQEASAETLISLAGLTDRLRERRPEVYGHLLAAGGELVAAYRAAVAGHERRWTAGETRPSEHIDLDGDPSGAAAGPAGAGTDTNEGVTADLGKDVNADLDRGSAQD
ncbi:DUF5304 family protein [Kitasatospora sp. NPDC004240]